MLRDPCSWRGRARIGLVCLLLFALGACHAIAPYVEQCRRIEPTNYVVVLPEGRERLASVQRFVERKQRDGYRVQVLRFAADGDGGDRLREVRRLLATARPAAGEHAYLLLLATHAELPMGPWRVVGVDEPVHSDVPLLLEEAPDPLPESAWVETCSPAFPWIAGRIPLDDERLLDRALAAGARYGLPGQPPLAMIGGERFAVWWDTSLIMAAARRRFARGGWRTVTYGEDWPCDVELGVGEPGAVRDAHEHAAELVGARTGAAAIPADALDGAEHPEYLVFLTHWAHFAPDVVYVNSHGSPGQIGQFLLSVPDVAAYLRLARRARLRQAPERPAVFVNIACSGGVAESPLLQFLFGARWACAVIGSTETTAPTPLWAALQTEVQAGEVLTAGLSVGLALRAARRSHYEHAAGSLSSWLFASTAAATARNVLGMTLYGDPSIAMPGDASRRGGVGTAAEIAAETAVGAAAFRSVRPAAAASPAPTGGLLR